MSDWNQHARVATTGNLTLSSTITSIDGVTLAGNGSSGSDVVLVKDQTTQSENGLYWANTSGPMVRTTDTIVAEMSLRVSEGAANRHTEWVLSTKAPITVGTTALAFSRKSESPTDALYFVSSSAFAADDYDGLSPGTALATLAQALTKLGANPGVIQLLSGSFTAPVGGLTLATRQGLIGAGATASQIIGASSGAAGPVLALGGSRSSLENLWVRVSLANGIGVRVFPSGTSNQNSRLTNLFVENQTTNAIAFGIGDNVTTDTSEVVLVGCDSVGNGADSVHMQVGNGTTGNVLDITNLGGNSQGNKYGVKINGGTLVSRGLNFQTSGGGGTDPEQWGADIWLKQPSVGNTSFEGGRSENARRFVISDFGYFTYTTTRIADYTVVNLTNTDGQGVRVTGNPTLFENVSLRGQSCPQYFRQLSTGPAVDGDFPKILTAIDCASDHPFPFQTNWSRPGKIIRSKGTRFTGNPSLQIMARKTVSDTWVRRHNISSTAAYTLNPFYFDAVDVNLAGSNAGTCTLLPGTPGQLLTICFQQDGVGGWTYSWPALCAFSGAAPANVTTSRNRQSCTFRYNGDYWEQCSPVTNVLPPSRAATPIEDNFSGATFTGAGTAGYPFWLNFPDTTPTPPTTEPATIRWEHVPGGGSLGIQSSKCVTPCVGYVGDSYGDDITGFAGPGAAAVIETGMATQTTGISATFTWQAREGIIAHYLDDQTFVFFEVFDVAIHARGYSHGQLVNFGNSPSYTALTAGSTHTLLVQCTSTGFSVTLDSGTPWVITPTSANLAKFGDLTKHGIISSSRSATFTHFKVS